MSWRRVHFRGLPGFWPTGSSASRSEARIAHCSSVRSWRAPAGGGAAPRAPRGGGFLLFSPPPGGPPSFPPREPPAPPPPASPKRASSGFFWRGSGGGGGGGFPEECVGVDGLSADDAGAGPGRQQDLQLVQDRVEAQAGAAAFGLVRSRVRNSWAAVTRVTWRCQPVKVRPSKWSRPRPVLHSR